uniref:Uncharacterized protein n=1 Tax=Oryza meridionalis TaxID=40149 RepID=A0A0E0DFS4_9ORYZ
MAAGRWWRRRHLAPWLPLSATRRRSGRAAGTLDSGGVGDLEWRPDSALQVRVSVLMGEVAVQRELAAVRRLPRCRSAPFPFLSSSPSLWGVLVGLRRLLVRGGSSSGRSDVVQSWVLLWPNMARGPAGGGTEVAWASSQGMSGGMQRAGGRVLRQVRKSAGGGAPGFQAKASLGDHRASSGYAFGCRNPLGDAVVGTSPPFLMGDGGVLDVTFLGASFLESRLCGVIVGRAAIGHA